MKCKKQDSVNQSLAGGLKLAVAEIKRLHEYVNDLRVNVNQLNYQIDTLEQYGRKESGRLREVPEAKQGEADDAVKAVGWGPRSKIQVMPIG